MNALEYIQSIGLSHPLPAVNMRKKKEEGGVCRRRWEDGGADPSIRPLFQGVNLFPT